jgi:hypothetical protein
MNGRLTREGGLTRRDVAHPMTSLRVGSGRRTSSPLATIKILERTGRKLRVEASTHGRGRGRQERSRRRIEETGIIHALAVRMGRTVDDGAHELSFVTTNHVETFGTLTRSVVNPQRKGMDDVRSVRKDNLTIRREERTVVRKVIMCLGGLAGKELRGGSNRAAEGLVGAISGFARIGSNKRGSDHTLVFLEGFLGEIKVLAGVRGAKLLRKRTIVEASYTTASSPIGIGGLAVAFVLDVRRATSEVLEVGDSSFAAAKAVVHLSIGNVDHLSSVSPVRIVLRGLEQGEHTANHASGTVKESHGGKGRNESC